MHSVTLATGRLTQPPGKAVAKNRPAPLTTRPAHTPRTPHSRQNRMSHCYIRVSRLTKRAVRVPSGFAERAISNRHTVRLEIAISRRKQTLGARSNRHFFTVLARNFAPARRAPRKGPALSNQQWQILEITVNNTKQTLGTRSNRQDFAVVARSSKTSTETVWHSHSWLCSWGDRTESHPSPSAGPTIFRQEIVRKDERPGRFRGRGAVYRIRIGRREAYLSAGGPTLRAAKIRREILRCAQDDG
jgi:hypothetical protein